jgi:hypothetical protein
LRRAAPPATLEPPSAAQRPRLRPLSYPLCCASSVSHASEAAGPAMSTPPAVPRRAYSTQDVHAVTEARASWPKRTRSDLGVRAVTEAGRDRTGRQYSDRQYPRRTGSRPVHGSSEPRDHPQANRNPVGIGADEVWWRRQEALTACEPGVVRIGVLGTARIVRTISGASRLHRTCGPVP